MSVQIWNYKPFSLSRDYRVRSTGHDNSFSNPASPPLPPAGTVAVVVVAVIAVVVTGVLGAEAAVPPLDRSAIITPLCTAR